ncbi:EamA family transporter [Leptolyngbya sp. PL-A3]|uniref:EamA family transporter n=1 Tax=Leptolyngbya sp. PL-A3 TaxID=2933911 RepID=UPI0032967F20
MEWLPFATIAYLVWSIATLTSKVLLSRYTSSLVVYTVSLGLVSLLPLLLVPVRGLTIPNPGLLCMALVGGMLYITVIMLYFKALSLEEASRVIPLWRFTPIFVLLLSGYLIDEHLTHYQLIAFVLLVLGGFGVSVKRIGDTFKLSPAFYWMLFSSLVGAIYNVLIKFIYLRLPYYDGFTLIRFGATLTALAVLSIPKNRLVLFNSLASVSNSIKALILFNAVLDLIGLAFLNFALSLAPVTLVNASAGIQAVFVLFFSTAISWKFPHVLKEDIDRRTLT